jgi:hypothetical protein
MAVPRTPEWDAEPACQETGRTLPQGQHPYDPVKKDLDPIGFALYRVQTFLAWIEDHRATFEKLRHTDAELAESELSNLRDSTRQGMVYLQRLSELLLAGHTIDPDKRLPESMGRGWFSSLVNNLQLSVSDCSLQENNGTGASERSKDPQHGSAS